MEQLSDRIRKARRLTGLSQSQAAQALAVHRGTFGHWERGGGHQPTSANLAQLAVVFGVSYEWLATGRGSPQVLSDDNVSTVILDCFAHSLVEEQVLLAVRKLAADDQLAVLALAHRLTTPLPLVVTKKLTMAARYADELPPHTGNAVAGRKRSALNSP